MVGNMILIVDTFGCMGEDEILCSLVVTDPVYTEVLTIREHTRSEQLYRL